MSATTISRLDSVLQTLAFVSMLSHGLLLAVGIQLLYLPADEASRTNLSQRLDDLISLAAHTANPFLHGVEHLVLDL